MQRGYRVLLGSCVAGSGTVVGITYARATSTERRKIRVGLNGVTRFLRSVSIGLLISLDYWWAGRGLEEVGELHDMW